MEVIKLLEYSQFLRHRYLDTFTKLPWDAFVKERGASFGSLRNILLHFVELLDRHVNQTIQGNAELPRIRYDDYDGMDKIKTYLDRVESSVNRYLSDVTPEELSRKVLRTFFDGSTLWMRVEDILIDLFQEETHHRGEFIAILWQMGIEPPHFWWGKYINK
jgi:uncharacterized damage-inducible protein DinB